MTSTLSTSLDSCPRCGYVLDQPPAPVPLPTLPPPTVLPPVTTYAGTFPAPPPAAAATSGLTMPSVPKILLGLGATCLLVAAAIFLAVAWSWLGVDGRTMVLVALTVTTGLAGRGLARRDLGVAAEALTVVSLGLVVLDVLGARTAGWLETSDQVFVAVAARRCCSSRWRCACPGPGSSRRRWPRRSGWGCWSSARRPMATPRSWRPSRWAPSSAWHCSAAASAPSCSPGPRAAAQSWRGCRSRRWRR